MLSSVAGSPRMPQLLQYGVIRSILELVTCEGARDSSVLPLTVSVPPLGPGPLRHHLCGRAESFARPVVNKLGECRPYPRFALDPAYPPLCFHETVDRREARALSSALFLSREKGFEDVRLRFGRPCREPVVAPRSDHILAGIVGDAAGRTSSSRCEFLVSIVTSRPGIASLAFTPDS